MFVYSIGCWLIIKMKCSATLKLLPKCRCLIQQRNISYQRLRNWYGSLVKPKPQQPPYAHITQIGDPILRTVCDPVPIKLIASPETKFLIKCMRAVFTKYNCVGLSAPQIGIQLRVFMMEFNEKHAKQYPVEEHKSKEITLVPFTVCI